MTVMTMTVADIRAMLQVASEGEFAVLEKSLAVDERKGVKSALEIARRRIAAEKAEAERLESLYSFERGFLESGQTVIVGLDEVGRGAVAGPLAVGAVVLPLEPHISGLNDSKQLTPEQREAISAEVQKVAVAWAVECVQPEEIDLWGMTSSLRRAFTGALARIEDTGIRPDVVLVDGNPLGIDQREINVVKGDAKCASIAAASIVAKVTRDSLMRDLAENYPGYDLAANKGYGSPQHIEAIREHGLTPLHRRSFCKSFMQESLF